MTTLAGLTLRLYIATAIALALALHYRAQVEAIMDRAVAQSAEWVRQ